MDKKENKFKKLLEKDGFYLVLFMCVCIVALTAVWVTKNSINNLAQNGFVNYGEGEIINEDKSKDLAQKDDDKEIDLVNKGNTVATSTKSKESLATAKAKVEQPKEKIIAKESTKAIMPVEGIIEVDYSDNTPIYSSTLEQFQLHKGLDIKAKEGSLVKATMNGSVDNITTNEQSGTTLTIKHDNNMFSVYSGLKDVSVALGQQLKTGDTIGAIGVPMITEIAQGSHLHFEMIKDGKNINPHELLK